LKEVLPSTCPAKHSPLVAENQNRQEYSMPFPDDFFQHTPALRDLITPPDTSEMRFGQERFAELDQ
jgi:hypothetical protein